MSRGYKIVRLDFVIDEIGEEETRQYLSDFESPLNKELQRPT